MNVSGPVFLFIYLLLAIAANIWLRRHFRAREAKNATPGLEFSEDPYRIACLRGGDDEAIRLAVFSLIDRGLLVEQSKKISPARSDADQLVRRPLERAVLQSARFGPTVVEIVSDPGVRGAASVYSAELGARRLLASGAVRAERFPAFAVCLAGLVGVAVLRIAQALLHGRHNIGFLILLCLLASFGLLAAYRQRLSAHGRETLSRLELLFGRLRRLADRVVPGGRSNEAVLLAAVFGFAALPADHFPQVKALFAQPAQRSSGDGGGGGDWDSGGDGDGGGSGCGGCGGGGCG